VTETFILPPKLMLACLQKSAPGRNPDELSLTPAYGLGSTRTLRQSSQASGLRTSPFSATMISVPTFSHRRPSKKAIRYLNWNS